MPIATGGTISTDGADTIHTFTSSGTFDSTGTGITEVKVLAVGGGGGGGQSYGGGGGAGGFTYDAALAHTPGSFPVTVGSGGAGGGGDGDDGGTSSFDTISCAGGGGGGISTANGRDGGSGGGAGWQGTAGSGTGGQGNDGGTGTGGTPFCTGGGGGSSAVGGSAAGSVSGSGGAGTANSISGASVTYAGGGGGGAADGGTTAGSGGAGGGGDGGATSGNGVAGTANTGGGGGGGGSGGVGAAGGSGIVIIRYVTPIDPPVAAFSGTPLVGVVPLSVVFTDASTNTPTGWAWSFGDSRTSTSQHPTNIYAVPGTYTVSLTASNASGSDGETKTNYVRVLEPTGTITVGSNKKIGQKELKTKWPVTEGLTASTTSQTGREMSLKPIKSLVPKRTTIGF